MGKRSQPKPLNARKNRLDFAGAFFTSGVPQTKKPPNWKVQRLEKFHRAV
jgi:hypothetical protein